MRHFLFLAVVLGSFILVGCGNLADKALYPYSMANETPTPDVPTEGYKAESLTVNADTQISTWYYENTTDAAAPVVIFFHGNGDSIGTLAKIHFADKVKTFGTHFVMFDYPLYGRSTGSVVNQQSLVEAGSAVLAWTEKKFPQSKIIVWGQSLGAGVAIQVASQHQDKLSKLILSQGWDVLKNVIHFHFSSLEFLIPDDWRAANDYNSIAAAESIRSLPVLIHHGEIDDVIPFEYGLNLSRHFAPGLVTWRPLPGRKHNDIYRAKIFWDDILEFVRR